ncbi:MAG: KH domain-containing protein [Candidatus Micrarchaeota archaeon]
MRLVALPKKTLNLLAKNNSKELREVERAAGAKIRLSDEGAEVEAGPDNPGREWEAEQVLAALEAGFPAKHALKLLKEDFYIEKIDLAQAFHGNEAQVTRYKARVIGSEGKAKKKIEELTGAFIAVGDESIAIIGRFEELKAAKEAVMRLLEGAPHSSVFYYLERKKKREESA